MKNEVREVLVKALKSPERVLSLADLGIDEDADDLSLPQLAEAILNSVSERQTSELGKNCENGQPLPRTIRFPYSRHSSSEELCDLLKIFKPKDVWPCTENPLAWHEGLNSFFLD